MSVFFSDSAPESAYKIQIKSNMRANISLGFYRSVCQYYEYQSSSWSYSGCVAKDESYPLVIACECNHMTSYGGSVLLSPDQIDFTDLTVSCYFLSLYHTLLDRITLTESAVRIQYKVYIGTFLLNGSL